MIFTVCILFACCLLFSRHSHYGRRCDSRLLKIKEMSVSVHTDSFLPAVELMSNAVFVLLPVTVCSYVFVFSSVRSPSHI